MSKLFLFLFSSAICISCGTTKAVVRNSAQATEIHITTNNPTSVSVSSSVKTPNDE